MGKSMGSKLSPDLDCGRRKSHRKTSIPFSKTCTHPVKTEVTEIELRMGTILTTLHALNRQQDPLSTNYFDIVYLYIAPSIGKAKFAFQIRLQGIPPPSPTLLQNIILSIVMQLYCSNPLQYSLFAWH